GRSSRRGSHAWEDSFLHWVKYRYSRDTSSRNSSSSTLMALPTPKSQDRNEALYMWKLMRSPAGGWAVPNRMYGVLKSLNTHRNITSSMVWLTGASIGSVTARHCRSGEAPSMALAS